MPIISIRKKIRVEKNILLPLIIFILFFFPVSFPQEFAVNKIEPPNWWTGMRWNTVQLMIYGNNLNDVSVTSAHPQLKVNAVNNAESPNYLFVDIEIPADLPAGEYEIVFRKGDNIVKYNFPILNRELKPEDHNGFSNEDVIYLIFADRFCDGNPDNNTIGDSLDEFTSTDLDGRQGGDIEGIISKLDYLKDLGITALWITPLLENNMWMSYHGYAATNLYKIDPRFGSNQIYKQLVSEAHQTGLKIILDHVSNHIGGNHTWMNDLPFGDWINGTVENHLPAHHDKMAFLDIHGVNIIAEFTQEGWFENYMPDLNQRNPFLKKYLIQNTLWWIEFTGIDGIREDTYPYCDQKYLSEWAEAILIEYPNFNIVGEIWKGVPSVISGYQHNSPVRKVGFDSNLPTVTDFALSDALRNFLSGEKSIYGIYEALVQDIVYDNPNNLLIFFDNHDIERAMFVAKGDIQKFKIALNLVLFTRGIPTLFYGTEIGIKSGSKHGELRKSFPGGFAGDERDAFTSDGRTERENYIFDYVNQLLKLRKEYPALAQGKLTQIYTGGDLYILLKKYEDEVMMILINSSDEDISFPTQQTLLFLPSAKKLVNIKNNKENMINKKNTITLKKMNTEIYKIEG
ncbi:MAG: cyclomaltodextrinase N-terminal domain-containing protein [Bacteroidetes bacterium]|nr:cyclomaltodextrinase N-terminal domain-containing protein [Bacteroidota bacterium]